MKEDDFLEKITSITSLSYFHHCQIHAYKKEIEVTFKALIQYSCIHESTSPLSKVKNLNASGQKCNVDKGSSQNIHYKSSLLEKCLHFSIGWKSLCKNHDDESQKKSSSPTSSLTPLAIILKVLVNQSVIPSCFTNVITGGLFHVAEKAIESQSPTFAKNGYQSQVEKYLQKSLTSSGKRNLNYGQSSESLNLIDSTIQSIMSSRYHAISLSKSYKMYTSNSSKFMTKGHRPTKTMGGKEIREYLKSHHSDSKTSTAIEMILFLRNVFLDQYPKNRYTTWSNLIPFIMTILKLLNQIDDMDVAMLQHRQRKLVLMNKSRQNHHLKLCKECQMLYSKPTTTTATTRKRSVTTSQLSALHGELSDNEEQKYILDLRQKPNHVKTYDDIHLGSCSLKELVSESKQIKKSLKEKQSCYVCMVKQNGKSSYTTSLPVHLVYFRAFLFHSWVDIIKLLSRNNRCDILKSIMYQALSMTFKIYESSSLRYCTILIAHHYESKDGYKEYLEILLSHFRTSSLSPTKTRKARVCLDLYCEIILECSFFDNPNECWLALRLLIDEAISIVACDSEKVESGAKQILQSVGYVFLKRNFLHARNMCQSFNEYVVKCSDLFCDADVWIHPMMNDDDRNKMILMLQQLGILSFLQSSFDDIDNNDQSGNGAWPFLDSVRDISKRIGPKVQCQNIVSFNPSFAPNDDECRSISTQSRRKREGSITDEVSILDFINEDITRHIFSFLGYKLLVRVSAVCKLWKTIGNENCFWEAHYKKRFNMISLDDFLPSDIDEEMKKKFSSKYCDYSNLKWRQLFDEKWKKERSLRSKLNKSRGSGWAVKTCNVLGCFTVLSSAKRHEKHICMHENNVLKKVQQLQRSKDRDEKRKLKRRKIEKE